MTPLEEIPFGDIAEEIALKYALSSVLIVGVMRTEKGSSMSWGYDGSAYELSGAARRFCFILDSDLKTEDGGIGDGPA